MTEINGNGSDQKPWTDIIDDAVRQGMMTSPRHVDSKQATTDAQIDAALAQPVAHFWTLPETLADLLTLTFSEDWRARGEVMGAADDDTRNLTCSLTLRFDAPISVARVHLLRMMEAERAARKQGK